MHNEAAEIRAGERPHKKIRKFGGHAYHLHKEVMTKVGAEAMAQHYRNRGHYAGWSRNHTTTSGWCTTGRGE